MASIKKQGIDLWGLSGREFYIRLKEAFLKSFFSYSISVVGSQHELAKLLGKHDSIVYNYQHRNRFISLNIISKIMKLLPKDEENKWRYLIEENLEEIKCDGNLSKSLKKPKFPICLTPILFKILGHVTGDGYIEMNKGSPLVGYTNQRIELIEQFKENIEEVFGNIEPYERVTKGDTYNIRYPGIVGIILSNLLGSLPSRSDIASLISQFDEQSKSLFLRALFDDEGYVSIRKYQIGIDMTNKEVIETIKKLLLEFNIETGKISEKVRKIPRKPIYAVRISGRKNLNLFTRIIGFDHPLKRDKIQVLLNNYKSIETGEKN